MNSEIANAVPSIDDTAADWFALRRSGRMTAQNLFELEVWLESDPAHLTAYKEVARTWALVHAVSTDPEMLALREDALGRRRPGRRWVFAAASVAAVMVFAWFGGAGDLWRDMTSPVTDQHFRTAVGETRSVILVDGSAVTLDSDSVLDVHETWRARSLRLEHGQGFFLVARDVARPFTVAAAGNMVTATGTAFNVRVDSDRFSVLLSEGRLHVAIPESGSEPSEQTDMEPGWQLTAWTGGERRLTRLTQQDQARALGWRTGQLTFMGAPLSAVAAELNRYSFKKVLIAPDLAAHTIDGAFRAGDIDGFVRLLVADRLARVENDTDRGITLVSVKKATKTPSP